MESYNEFSITVSGIKYGWMDINISNGGRNFAYSASYLSDPLDDLLNTALSIIRYDNKMSFAKEEVKTSFYFLHELEPGSVLWLFKPIEHQWDLMIFDNWSLLDSIDENEGGLEEADISDEDLIFSLRGPLVPFVEATIKIFPLLNKLQRYDDSDWGYNYSIEKVNILLDWLSSNELKD